MQIYKVVVETTLGEVKEIFVGCNGIASLILNLKKSMPDLRRIIGNPKRVNRENESFYDLRCHE